jgi:hypothetical protein
LLEDGRARGVLWFWSGVSRTALSLLWSSFAEEPSRLAVIGFRGLLLNLSLFAMAFIGIMVLSVVFATAVGIFAYASGLKSLAPDSPWLRWPFGLAGMLAFGAVQSHTGRWLAGRARDKEIAVCVAFVIVQTIIMQIVGEVLFGGRWFTIRANAPGLPGPDITWGYIAINNILMVTALLAGAMRVRIGRIKTATS